MKLRSAALAASSQIRALAGRCLGSLKARLLLFCLALALLLSLAAVAAAALHLHHETSKYFDTVQLSFARQLAAWDPDEAGAAFQNRLPDLKKSRRHGHYDGDALSFAVFSKDGALLLSDGRKGRRIVFDGKGSGFSEARLRGDDEKWRILWMDSGDGRRRIAVAQELDFRSDLIFGILQSQLLILAAFALALCAGLFIVITRALRPVGALSRQLSSKRPGDESPLDARNLPSEIRPLADELNSYFKKSSAMMRRERSFVSDAAHELRTPLAGLVLQSRIASDPACDPGARKDALESLVLGARRCSNLVRQLLTLSRLDDLDSRARPSGAIPGMSRGRACFKDLVERALLQSADAIGKKHLKVESSFQDGGLVIDDGYPEMAFVLVRNLIENACRYSLPESTIRIFSGHEGLVVENACRRYGKSDRARLGERFFRPAGQQEDGSGLGLSIARAAAAIHRMDFQIALEDGPGPGEATFTASARLRS
ncbi:MAG: histidine kinase dimerization/phospho-acceptor domain-containing protein [Succinivibrio sp.]